MFKNIVGSKNSSVQIINIISHYKTIGFNTYVLQQAACLVVNQITVGNFAFFFNCTPWVGLQTFVAVWPTTVYLLDFYPGLYVLGDNSYKCWVFHAINHLFILIHSWTKGEVGALKLM